MVLLLGLAGAGAVYRMGWLGWTVWMGSRGVEGADDRLLAGPSRAERHQVELLYGKFGLRILEMINALERPGTLAVIVAAVLVLIPGLIAGLWWSIAHIVDRHDDT
jgi:hypothetical protein